MMPTAVAAGRGNVTTVVAHAALAPLQLVATTLHIQPTGCFRSDNIPNDRRQFGNLLAM
jgi:hypothetical protein